MGKVRAIIWLLEFQTKFVKGYDESTILSWIKRLNGYHTDTGMGSSIKYYILQPQSGERDEVYGT